MPGGPTESNNRIFLRKERVEAAGAQVASLILDGIDWIERRKERVTIVDDTVLRRQISVEFSLRSDVQCLVRPDDGGPGLYCAPIFALPKVPADLRAFDLVDETGSSLRLTNRTDNARISGASLRCMAARKLKIAQETLHSALADELNLIATGAAAEAEQRAERLIDGGLPAGVRLSSMLDDEDRLTWWLRTIAHSSIVVAIFRAAEPSRKLIKLTFEEPLTAAIDFSQRVGWKPYSVIVDSPLIEARTFHFEAESPPGLRIIEASLTDQGHERRVSESGFLRRVHLYRHRAQVAGAATAVLQLQVSGNFIGGAVIAAVLTTVALFACMANCDVIARNPSGAPALLLFLPGLIATYVARPDRHALTTRLLSYARRLLLLSAGTAYVAAGKVALSNTSPPSGTPGAGAAIQGTAESLHAWLLPLAIASAVLLAGLTFTFLRSRGAQTKLLPGRRERRRSGVVAAPLTQVRTWLHNGAVVPEGYELLRDEATGAGTDGDERAPITFGRATPYGESVIAVDIERLREDEQAGTPSGEARGENVSLVRVARRRHFHGPGFGRRGRDVPLDAAARGLLAELQRWAAKHPSHDGETRPRSGDGPAGQPRPDASSDAK